MSTAANQNWQRAFPLADLPPGKARAVKLEGQQIAIFHRDSEVLYACENRCPHEGYPLVRGRLLGDSILMCIWHSFTFNLKDGRCLFGDEDVQTYPVRVRDGQVDPRGTCAFSNRIPWEASRSMEGLVFLE